MQEQLPSLHAANEHFGGGALPKFNTARTSKVIFQRFPNAFFYKETHFVLKRDALKSLKEGQRQVFSNC